MADMKILQKYSTSSRYSNFTDTDRCFFFKPAFDDLSETQFKWTMGRDEFNALYHYELQSRGHQATIRVEYEKPVLCRAQHPARRNIVGARLVQDQVPRYSLAVVAHGFFCHGGRGFLGNIVPDADPRLLGLFDIFRRFA